MHSKKQLLELREKTQKLFPKVTPYLGGTKAAENAIIKWNSMNPMQRGKYLVMPSVKSKRTQKGKYWAIIELIKRGR